MTNARVLFVGFDPATMKLAPADEATPGLRPKLQTMIDVSIAELREAGYQVEWLPIGADHRAADALRKALANSPVDCVVIGAGIRLMKEHTSLFESLVNIVHLKAPSARLAFNSTPADGLQAVQRQLADFGH